MKRMSFAATTGQMYDRTKTVTRRPEDSWGGLVAPHDDEPGSILMAIEKGMGLKAGERQVCIHPIEVLASDIVPLEPLTKAEVIAEGFPLLSPAEFIAVVWEPMHGPVTAGLHVRRIEFRHRIDLWTPGMLPSNGTSGDIFRHDWCDGCQHDHAVHLDIENAGDYHHPEGVCSIFTESLIAYPGPGPKEWERRTLGDPDEVSTWEFEERCTAHEDCQSCERLRAESHEKIWPTTVAGAWKPTTAVHVDGQIEMAI